MNSGGAGRVRGSAQEPAGRGGPAVPGNAPGWPGSPVRADPSGGWPLHAAPRRPDLAVGRQHSGREPNIWESALRPAWEGGPAPGGRGRGAQRAGAASQFSLSRLQGRKLRPREGVRQVQRSTEIAAAHDLSLPNAACPDLELHPRAPKTDILPAGGVELTCLEKEKLHPQLHPSCP